MKLDVFDRSDFSGNLISSHQYNLVIGLVLCWGFFVNWLMLKGIPASSILSINRYVFYIGYFASCLLGCYLFNTSTDPLVSFIGYNLVVVPFGMVLNVVIGRYDSALVLDAVRITGMVTFTMMVLGSALPAFFEEISGALSSALLSVIIIEFVEVYFFGIHHGVLDWAVALIFCGYIGYDWGRANSIPMTLDNAVDSAAALYMDIINLFVRILRILGRK